MGGGEDRLFKNSLNTKRHFGFQILEWEGQVSIFQIISSLS